MTRMPLLPLHALDVLSVRDIWLGLDTGGTYTDAVALDGDRHIVASAKALTTHWDLAVGLGEAVNALLSGLPAGVLREQVSLVSVSTTLATNAVVESRFSPICTILVGFDERMTESSQGLKRGGGGVVVRVRVAMMPPVSSLSRSMKPRSMPPCGNSPGRSRPSRWLHCFRCAMPRTNGACASGSARTAAIP